MSTSLREMINQRILNDVIKACRTENEYKVLVLDKLATKIVSSCCKMVDIMSDNIMVIEDLHKRRQPMPRKDAIYFLSPNDTSVRDLLDDWRNADAVQYKQAHLFFTDRVPEALFQDIAVHNLSRYIRNFKELNVAFIASEKRIFDLDQPSSLKSVYGSETIGATGGPAFAPVTDYLERVADQLSTVLATLGEYPSIRYYNNTSTWSGAHHDDKNERLANLVLAKMNSFKADDAGLGESPDKKKSELIILDRSFDVISPLLHELTYQAMVTDLVCSNSTSSTDVYVYEKVQPNGEMKLVEVPLDESDALWVKLRHKHIAEVSHTIPEYIKNFSSEKNLMKGKESMSIKELTALVRKMPQHQKEMGAVEVHFRIAEQANTAYSNVQELCKIEQNLATGKDAQYEKLKEPMRDIVPILLNTALNPMDKVRIILLYIIYKGGTTQENVDKLVTHAGLDDAHRNIIQNYSKLGVPMFEGSVNTANEAENGLRGIGGGAFKRKNREHQVTYQISRWNPAIKDVIEGAIEQNLDTRQFPYLVDRREAGGGRRGYNWQKNKSTNGSRIIIFINGGMTPSEMRCAYEVSNYFLPKDAQGNPIETSKPVSGASHEPAKPALSARQKAGDKKTSVMNQKIEWEVMLGSTQRLIPKTFLEQLGQL